jgi:hypothetical protein
LIYNALDAEAAMHLSEGLKANVALTSLEYAATLTPLPLLSIASDTSHRPLISNLP